MAVLIIPMGQEGAGLCYEEQEGNSVSRKCVSNSNVSV